MKAIMNDLSKIGTQFKNIDDTVNAFPASGVNGANVCSIILSMLRVCKLTYYE